jgi:hypothetical protein
MPYAKPKFGGGLAVSVDVWHEIARQMILWMKKRHHITLNGRLDKGCPPFYRFPPNQRYARCTLSQMNSISNEISDHLDL